MTSSKFATFLLTKSVHMRSIALVGCLIIIYVLLCPNPLPQNWNERWSLDVLSREIFAKREYQKPQGQVCDQSQGCQESDNKTVYNCSVIDFFAAIEPTARGYDSDLVCDEFSEKYDIICRMNLRQIGLHSQESTICPMADLEKVPKVVYYVIFGIYKFRFLHYVSVMAAKRFISPTAIYVIGDQHPTGKWWEMVLKNVHGVRYLYREKPGNISGLRPVALSHVSDIVRLQAVYMNGGIYLDADMVVVKDLEPLLAFELTMGMVDNQTGMGNAFIAAKRGNSFLREWYGEYARYKNEWKKYFWNSLQVPRDMYYKNKSRVNEVSDKLYRPHWRHVYQLFNGSDYPWYNSYAVHVWSHGKGVPESPEEIATANTTVAQIFRHVLYGSNEIIQSP